MPKRGGIVEQTIFAQAAKSSIDDKCVVFETAQKLVFAAIGGLLVSLERKFSKRNETLNGECSTEDNGNNRILLQLSR